MPFVYNAPNTIFFVEGQIPQGLSISGSQIKGTPTAAGIYPIFMDVGSFSNSTSINLTITILALPAISTTSLPAGITGQPYSLQLTALNSPTSFTATGLPATLTCSPSGLISGTPTAASVYNVGVYATNSVGPGATTYFTLTIGLPVPSITTTSLTAGVAQQSYSCQLAATFSPTSYTVTGLPSTMSCSATGLITGTPTATGTYNVNVYATNSYGPGATTVLVLTVGQIPGTPDVTTPTLSEAPVNGSYNMQLAASGGATSFTVTGLPPGMTYSPSGLITGTPTSTGTYTVTVYASNGSGLGPAVTFTLTVGLAPTMTTQPTNQSAVVGGNVTFSAAASGYPAPTVQWQVSYDAGATYQPLSGATSTTLSFVANLEEDGNLYQAVFTNNGNQTVTSNIVSLAVSATAVFSSASTYTFTTIGGGHQLEGYTDGIATGALLAQANGVAADASGNVYIADTGNNTIREVSSGQVTTIAGTAGVTGSSDGTGPGAQFNRPGQIAVDTSGNLYVADQLNNTIRKITSGGVVTTFAGTAGVAGSKDGAGNVALFNQPAGVAVDTSGNVYVADTDNQTIRKITSTGMVSTLAGTVGVTGAANLTGTAAQFNFPAAVAVDASSNVYVADLGNNKIRKITSGGAVTDFEINLVGTQGVAVDGSGNVYATGGLSYMGTITSAVWKFSSSGTGGTIASGVDRPGYVIGVAVSVISGVTSVYVADAGTDQIFRLPSTNAYNVFSFAGASGISGSIDGSALGAEFNHPAAVTLDPVGNLYVADSANNSIRIITPGGVASTFAGVSFFGGVAQVGSADGIGPAASFNAPGGIASDKAGNIYVSDTGNNTIRKITPSAIVTTLAGTATPTGGYQDGMGAAAQFNRPSSLVVDGVGNIYVVDRFNSVIRKITPAGLVSTFAGQVGVTGLANGPGLSALFNGIEGLAIDRTGNLYVADSGNNLIREITSAGMVSTFAGSGTNGEVGGAALSAQFSSPNSIAVDASGNVFVGDGGTLMLREISSAGEVSTLAGAPVQNYASIDGTGTEVYFGGLDSIAVDSSDNLYVADTVSSTIRKGLPDISFSLFESLAPYMTGQAFALDLTDIESDVFAYSVTSGAARISGVDNNILIITGSGSIGLNEVITPPAKVTTTYSGYTSTAEHAHNQTTPGQPPDEPDSASSGTAAEYINAFTAIAARVYGAAFTITPPLCTSSLPVTVTVKSGPATLTGTTLSITGPGTVTLAADQIGNTNYKMAAEVTTSFNASAATLTYTATPVSRNYGVANPVFTGTVTGFVNTDTQASATTGTLAFISPGTTTSIVGSYAINGSGLSATNYVFSQAAGNATALTVTALTSPVFSQWAAEYGATGGTSGDSLADGVPNLLKYLYDINPTKVMTASDRAALPVSGVTSIGGVPYLTLTYGQSKTATGITLNVQTSADLKTLTARTLTTGTPTSTQYVEVPTGTTDPNGDPYMEIEVPASGSVEFIRLNVTSP